MNARRALAVAALAFALAGAPATPGWVSPARAAQKPAYTGVVTREAFVSSVEGAIAAVAKARPSIGEPGSAAALASELEAGVLAPSGVEADGRTMDPDRAVLRRLTGDLASAGTPAARRDALDSVAAQLASLRQALGVSGAAPASDPAALRELLAGRAASGPATSTNDWLGEQLRRLVARLAAWLQRTGGAGSGIGGWVFYGALALAGAATLYFIVRAVLVWRRGASLEQRGRAGDQAEAPVVTAAADLPADALAFAERLAADGRRRDAVRALYGGAARRLVEEGAVRRMRTRTGAELLRDVRANSPAAAAALAELTGRFEASWYGHADPGDAGFLAARASYSAVLDAASSGPGPGGARGGDPA